MNIFDFPDKYPCPICGELQKIGISKKEKPYFFCDPCGVQVFIRGQQGISRLIAINDNQELFREMKSLGRLRNSRLLQIRTRLELLDGEINRYEENGLYFESPEHDQKYSKMVELRDELEKEFQKLITEDNSVEKSK